MDLEYTFWQMYLLCTNPKVVYRHTMYRKREPPTLHPPVSYTHLTLPTILRV